MRPRSRAPRKRSPAVPVPQPATVAGALAGALGRAQAFVVIVQEEAEASGKITGARIRQELRRL